ncbi:MAG: lactate utilization protein [Lachnospiraceae bacterium]|jgi:hypothetical protein|nr:lactate utilization protein [Lachnospiraceae bacterium]
MGYKEDSYKILAEQIIQKLKERNMDGAYFATAEQCKNEILQEIPQGASVTWGGSVTITDMGLIDAVKSNPGMIAKDRMTAKTPEEKRTFYSQQTLCDYFLMSTNAITLDGQLVNIDGAGGRVACLITGPSHVFVIAGMNKVESDLDAAMKRVRNFAAPANNLRLSHNTPCTKAGRCCDCLTSECICNQIVVTRRSGIAGRIKVFLIGETLGY